MKSKEELIQMLFETLDELMSGDFYSNPGEEIYLEHKLEILNDILGDEVPEEYREQIRDALTVFEI